MNPLASLKNKVDNTPTLSDLQAYHNNRNVFNEDYSEDWVGGVPAFFHQFGEGNENNVKFVSPDGHSEAIFRPDGTLVTDSLNGGTYNYADPQTDKIGHFLYDMLPYFIWGNGSSTACEE